MRVRLVFSLNNKGAVAPFHHQNLLASLLSTAYGAPLPEDICFSCLKGQTKVTSLGLSYYSSKVSLVISSASKDLLDKILAGIFSQESVEVGQLFLVPDSVSMEEAPKLEDQNRYVCISPLVAVKGHGGDPEAKRFIAPDTDAFSDILYESTMLRMQQSGRYTKDQIASYFRFQVIPDPAYLAKMKREEKKFARIYLIDELDEEFEVRGYTFPFTLYAHPDVHEFLFDCGIGEHCNRGFGMIDLAEQLFHNRMVPYYIEGQKVEVQERAFLPRERVA